MTLSLIMYYLPPQLEHKLHKDRILIVRILKNFKCTVKLENRSSGGQEEIQSCFGQLLSPKLTDG